MKPFTNRDLFPILESYRMIYEDAESKNRHRARSWIRKNHPEAIGQTLANGIKTDEERICNELSEMMPSVRLADNKFLQGVVRIYFEDMAKNPNQLQRMAQKLDGFLKIIASDAHVNEYDHNLNGLNFKELENRFSEAVSKNLEDDRNAVGSKEYEQNSEYEIVQIPDFEAASEYAGYTSWCITGSENMYDKYTHGGTGIFYFCLKRGFEDVPRHRGEGCPLDEYGLSMIAVSVTDTGALNTCTCRWNHDCGGNDHIMDTQEISELLGVNFYQTFKPRSMESVLEKYRNESLQNIFADRMGWIYVRGKEYDSYDYIVPTENGIRRYREVFDGISNAGRVLGIAGDHFYWYDMDACKEIPPPESVTGSIRCNDFAELTSLKGCPKELVGQHGALICTYCPNLVDISDCPSKLEYVQFEGSPNVMKRTNIDAVIDNKPLLKKLLFSNETIETDSEGNVTAKVSVDELEDVYNKSDREGLSWETVKTILDGTYDIGWYDSNEIPLMNMDGDVFNSKLEDYGLDWDDMEKLYEDGELELEGVMTPYQSRLIYDLLTDDFYDGKGIQTFYEDCERSGAEMNAFDEVESSVMEQMRFNKSYGLQDGSFEAVFSRGELKNLLKHYIFVANMSVAQMLRLDYEVLESLDPVSDYADGAIEKITVYEPYYGFSGFDKSYWEDGMNIFADKVINILENPPVEDAEGQRFFDFDKEYRNK